ncbi:MAG: DUF4426 domain-containing protein [Idiomarina sp.]|nr:DUF4426 domain-containing protein [Idiomarina sp.]
MKWAAIKVMFCILSLLSASALAKTQGDQGGQFQRLGSWEVHYSAFPSTMLQPEVASAYNLRRSNARGVVSLSVLDATREGKPAQRVVVEGYALNEAGQRRTLSFRRIIDEPSIYYLTDLPHQRQERYRFFITLRQGDTTQELRFAHTFYQN